MLVKFRAYENNTDILINSDDISRVLVKDEYRGTENSIIYMKDGTRISVRESVDQVHLKVAE